MSSNRNSSAQDLGLSSNSLLSSFHLGSLVLPNRFVMSPMTRARTANAGRVPLPIEAEYYSQRATAGLIVTGGIYISSEAVGGDSVPGIYTEEQLAGWFSVTDAVHKAGGRIFAQLAHSGSVSHPSQLNGKLPVAPSPVDPEQKVLTTSGYIDTVTPRALSPAEIDAIVNDYRTAAENAKKAGFDGVELHGGNIYLIAEFLNTSTNRRTDAYGGSPENRARIAREILTAIGTIWEHNRIGVKVTPSITGIGAYAAIDCLLEWLSDFAPAYLHLRRGFDTTGKPIEMLRSHTFDHFGDLFNGVIIGNGGLDLGTAVEHVAAGSIDLVSFARLFISNPDLVARFEENHALTSGDATTFYSGGAHGYTDYPFMSK